MVIGIGLIAKEVLSTNPFRCNYLAINAIKTPGDEAFHPSVSIGMSAAGEIFSALDRKMQWGFKDRALAKKNLSDRMKEKFLPGIIFDVVANIMPHACMVMDTGSFCTIGEHMWKASNPHSCLLSGQGRYMGTSLPMAIGASIYNPSIPTVACVGDGGIGMYLSEILLAVKLKLPILIILMTDGAFGSIRTRAIKCGLTQKPLIIENKSWTSIFESLNIISERSENLQRVIDFLNAWQLNGGPAFLEIPFNMDEYEAMTIDIR